MGGRQYTMSRGHGRWPPRPPWTTASLTLVLLLFVVDLACSSITCGSGIKSPGVTIPRGDIILEYGSHKPLEITCILDPDNEIVKNMFPVDDGKTEPSVQPSQRIQFFKNADPVPAEYVTVVNSTASRLFIPDPPVGLDSYYCMLLNHSSGGPVANYDQSSPSSNDSSTFSTVQPTSLETSGPPPLMSGESAIGVCLNRVAVGYKPLPITNYSCISDNWVSLRCNWTKPQNPVLTTYKVYFKLTGRSGRVSVGCPTDSDIRDNTCYWDMSTTPVYRTVYEYYNFTFTGQNVFGSSNNSFVFNHYGNVIPASPTDITVLDKTHSSAMLMWSVGKLALFPRELIHKIEYKSQWDSHPEHWTSVNVYDVCNTSTASNQTNPTNNKTNCRKRNREYYYFNVTDLKYPFALYDIRIYVRSSLARGDDKWSAPGFITLKTKPTIPRRPPRTDVGSFECVMSLDDKSTRDIFIYWQTIDDSEKYGDLFEYRAYYTFVTADNVTINFPSNETNKNYAKFNGLNTSIGYTFIIYSANKEGLSSEYSTVYVPSESDRLSEPLSFTKMAFNDQSVFELSWKNASNQKLFNANQLYDYTLFWCESVKDRPYQCTGYLNWVHVSSSESCYNVTSVDNMKIYQFAISANSKSSLSTSSNSFYQPTSSSSGMVWALCTVLHNKIIGKIKSVWVNMIGSTMMELGWKLDCSDRIGVVLGFRILYCPVVSLNNSDCKGVTLNKIVSGEMAQDGSIVSITNLKPYTTYKVTIALITKHGEGLHSDPLLNTTLEGAPDIHDLKISVTGLTNTSVTLQWSPPKVMNGIFRHYYVYYYVDRELQHILQQDSIDELLEEQQTERRAIVTEPKCRLEHLESYIKYKITVTACTTVCSNRSLPLMVRTAVGLPGRVPQPNLLYENSTRIIASWPKPVKPAGPIDYFELIVAHHSGPTNSQTANGGSSPTALAFTQIQENPNHFLYRSDSNVFHVPVPDCNDEDDNGQQTFSFAVRAVNINPLDPHKPYYGPWSVPGSVSCVLTGLPLVLHLVIWSCLFIVLGTVFTYWGNRFWHKYKFMHNVQVVLPPTLNVNFTFDHCGNFGDSALDSCQEEYCAEDGHMVYDNGVPADAVVCEVANNDNNSSAPDDRKSNTASTDSDRLPLARWSPATATTTIVVAGDDDESASSKHHLILPPPLPKMNRNRFGDNNSIKSSDGNIAPTEPVLPFFSLPDTPTLTLPPVHSRLNGIGSSNFGCPDRAASTSRNNGYQDSGLIFNVGFQNSIVSHNNGYQDNRNVNYSNKARTNQNSGYQDSGICGGLNGIRTDYLDRVPCATTDYQDHVPCAKIDYQDDDYSGSGGNDDSGSGGDDDNDGSGQDDNDGSGQDDSDGSGQDDSDGSVQDDSGGGGQDDTDGGGQDDSGGGVQDDSGGGVQDDSGGGVQDDSGSGLPCVKIDYRDNEHDLENGYQDYSIAVKTDYKDNGGTDNRNDYRDDDTDNRNDYRDDGTDNKNDSYQESGIIVVNSVYQDAEEKRPDEVIIGCDKRAKNDITPMTSIDYFIDNQQQLLNQNLQQLSEDPLADDSDEIHPRPSAVELNLTLPTSDNKSDNEQKDETSPLSHFDDSPQQQSPSPQQPQLKQQNCLDGYCGKQMIITAAAANEFGKNSDGDQLLPSNRYVMLDMVAAQKRLLDLGRLEFAKPTAASVVQSVAVEIGSNGCGTAVDQRDSNIEVTTQ